MRLFLIIFIFCPLLGYTQSEKTQQLYLTAGDQITTQKSELKCVPNPELSHGYTHTYDCKTENGKTLKQLSLNIHLSPAMANDLYAAYKKNMPEYGEYLLGEFKEGKPYNGFFHVPQDQVNEWLMFDFYKNGQLVSQLYNNLYKTIAGKDSRLNFITLDTENTFVNGKLQNGIAITPLQIKKGAGEVVLFLNNFKPAYVMLDLYAENYGEFIKVLPVTNGFLVSDISQNSLKVTYVKEGRTLEYYDSKNKLTNRVNMVQAELTQTEGIDLKRPYTYFEKDGKIYKEQVKNPAELFDNHDYDVLNTVAGALYSNSPLNTVGFVNLMEHDNHRVGILGYHAIEDGKEFGYVYKKGNIENTYSLDVYRDGKVFKPGEYSIRNKKLDELISILQSRTDSL